MVGAAERGATASRRARHLVDSDAGTVILLSHNITGRTQLRSMLAGLRSAAPHRLLVASDEEGGRVSRLDDRGLVTPVPAARWLANNTTAANVEWRGRRLGGEMRELGVNWNFAPVYDVSSTRSSSVIGDRSYSSRAAVVARYGGAFARGLRAGGVHTTAKHFPGHGRTTTDSHNSLPTVYASRETLVNTDLYPFRVAKSPLSAVMAIRAGADIALTTQWDRADAMTDGLRDAVIDMRLSRVRMREAVRRVLRLKGYSTGQVDCLLSPS